MTRQGLRNEAGFALVTAMLLLFIMLVFALASFSLVDVGQHGAARQRERETSFNLAEGVLSSQGFTLAQNWPGTAPGAPDCTETTISLLCPSPGTLAAANAATPAAANFTNVDASANVTWTTKVRDNGPGLSGAPGLVGAYDPAHADDPQSVTVNGVTSTCPASGSGGCRYDADGDGKVWVDARAVVRGIPRHVVGLVRLQRVLEATPRSAVTAGGINVNNNGHNTMIYANGSQVVVRCPVTVTGCVSYNPGQIQPAPTYQTSGGTVPPPLMTPAQLARFKQRAITDGHYYAAGLCPPNDINGAVVWVESCPGFKLTNSTLTAPCNPAAPPKPAGGGTGLSQACINQYNTPGIFIVHCGAIDLGGGVTYVGIVYAVNDSDGTCVAPSSGALAPTAGNCSGNNNAGDVVSMEGGFGIWGVLAIDGQGCLNAGANGIQVQFDPNVFRAVTSYGTVSLVQNTWRELPAG